MASRSTKLVALAVATGTVVVAGSTAATAAGTTDTVKSYVGATDGFAINVKINLPSLGLAGLPTLPGVGNLANGLTINETIAVAKGQVTKTETLTGNATASVFQSSGDSVLKPLFDGINKTATATLGGTLNASDSVLSQDLAGLAKVGVGNVAATIVPGTASKVTQAVTGSKIANVNVGLGGALASPVSTLTTTVNSTLDQVTGALFGTSDTPGPLGALLTKVTGSLPNTGTPIDAVVTGIQNLPAQLQLLVSDLKTSISGLTSDGGVMHVGLIGTDQVVKPNGTGLSAVTTSQIGDLSVLGGLVSVDALKTIATASANGVKGGALADIAKSSLAHVKIGSLANIQANVDRIQATVAGLGLDAVNQALGLPSNSDLVTQLLNTLTTTLASAGVQVGYIGTDVKEAAADGSKAVASTQGIGIRVGLPAALTGALGAVGSAGGAVPLGLDKPIVEIQFVPASASVQQQNSTVAVAPKEATAGTVASSSGPAPTKKLAYTGASLPMAAGLGSLLIAGAAVTMRRRRSAEV